MYRNNLLLQQPRSKTFFSNIVFSRALLLLATGLILIYLIGCSASKPAPILDRTTSSSSSSNPSNANATLVNPNPSVKVTPIAAPKPMTQKNNPREAVKPESKNEPKPDTSKPATITDSGFKLLKPTNSPVITPFNEVSNKGVEFSGKLGDPILAAADGKVIYSGSNLRTYGNLIILNHNNSFVTVYANNKTLLVKEGDTVKRGQKIAEMGNSESDKVKLHFELRKNSKPIDPSSYFVEN